MNLVFLYLIHIKIFVIKQRMLANKNGNKYGLLDILMHFPLSKTNESEQLVHICKFSHSKQLSITQSKH